MSRRPAHARRVAALTLALATIGLGGCALGERPTLADAPTVVGQMTGDAAIDAVLQRLDSVDAAVFDAEYTALRNLGAMTSSVRIAQTAATRSSVTIDNVRFLVDGATTETCDIDTGACTPGLDPQKISSTGLQTPDVVLAGLAKRLRLDATADVGPATASTETIAGLVATCVDVPLARGTVRYCVLDNGVAAKYAGGDFVLDLVAYSETPDESLFTQTRAG